MSPGVPLTVSALTKTFGTVTAVDDLSFRVEPGRVTGFLGPNGAGKTTTLRCLLGLVTPTSGTTAIGDTPYAQLRTPAITVGAALEATGFHPGRTARDHLRVLALAAGISSTRVRMSLEQVGLAEVADRRAGEFSLGMRQRLQLAAALLGDPGVLVLDEPANGLDPEGIAWLRVFLRGLAAQGHTVLLSSHVLAEVEQTVDDVVIVARGRLVRACPLTELTEEQGARVLVRTPDEAALRAALTDGSVLVTVTAAESGGSYVTGASAEYVGHLAFTAGVELHELRTLSTELETVFLSLTADRPSAGGAT
ncbi:MAG: ATP-binding cassette domain-containing protein [Candidatus Nanopelagicales bacterium]